MSIYFSQSTLFTSFPAVMGGFRRERRRGYGEKQTTRISSIIFLSFVDILEMITSYRKKAYQLICEKFQKDKHCRLAVRQVAMISFI